MTGVKNIGGSLPFYTDKKRQELKAKICQGIISPNLSLIPFQLEFPYDAEYEWKLVNEIDGTEIILPNDLLTKTNTANACSDGKPVFVVSYTGAAIGISIPCGYWSVCFVYDGVPCYSEVMKVTKGLCALESVGLKVASCDGVAADIFADDRLVYPLVSQDNLDVDGNSLGPVGFTLLFSTITSPLIVCREVVTECQTIKKRFCITWDRSNICGTIKIDAI